MGKHRVEFNNPEATGPNKRVLRLLNVGYNPKGKNQQLEQLTEITFPPRIKSRVRKKNQSIK